MPLDFQQGVPGGVEFPNSWWWHLDASTPGSQAVTNNRIPFNEPLASFGSYFDASPLYFGQTYRFGSYAGGLGTVSKPWAVTNALAISVYDRQTMAFQTNVFIPLPNPQNTNQWALFLRNGATASATINGLDTTVYWHDALDWGTQLGDFGGDLIFSHTAKSNSSPFVFLVQVRGYTPSGEMVLTQTNAIARHDYSLLYFLDFEQRPAWHSLMLDQPQFAGQPMPSEYQGKSVEELTNAPAVVSNTASLSPSAFLALNLSPELRRHPVLDRFVQDLGGDPLALAAFVMNEIEVTDAVSYNVRTNNRAEASINPGGVSRGALGVFLERQGSPLEQCALLVYLLRQAGYPAAYIFPETNTVKMLDSQLSKLLRAQLRDARDNQGNSSVPHLIDVNYPWVTVNSGGNNWVPIFPWLKDTEVVEGLNPYDFLPTNYNNGAKWVGQYLLGDTNILGLVPGKNTPEVLFPKFIEQSMRANAPGVSLDDLGLRAFNRRNQYARWTDFPRPFLVAGTNNAVESLGQLDSAIFDTIRVEVTSRNVPAKKIDTGELRMLDVHNRKFLLWPGAVANNTLTLTLSLAAFGDNTNNPAGAVFGSDPALLQRQHAEMTLNSGDDSLLVKTTYRRHRAVPTGYGPSHWESFLGLSARLTFVNESVIKKGDLAAICLSVGRVTPQMISLHAEELWRGENARAQNTNAPAPFEDFQGTSAYLSGMDYYQKLSRFRVLNEALHKVMTVSRYAAGLSKLSPGLTNGFPANGAIKLERPSVDMVSDVGAVLGNRTMRLDSGQDPAAAIKDFSWISIANGSAQEHEILNTYYGRSNAVSTMRLLQLSEKRKKPGLPGVVELTAQNYKAAGASNYFGKALKDHDPAMWAQVTNTFLRRDGFTNFAFVYISPGPVTNESRSYRGMAALIADGDTFAALIGDGLNGGYSDPTSVYYPANPPQLVISSDGYVLSLPPPTPDGFAQLIDQLNLFNPVLFPFADANRTWVLNFTQEASQQDFQNSVGLPSTANAGTTAAVAANTGNLGGSNNRNTAGGTVADPVDVMSGAFYVDETDLSLPGPLPLQIRRNYSSMTLADNQFGQGWKLNYQTYLVVSTNEQVIHAAEPGGSVLAYRRDTNTSPAEIWRPRWEDNPSFNNHSVDGIGSTANLFNAFLVRTNGTNYTLNLPDGSARVFHFRSYPIFNSGTNAPRARPYLQSWRDARGNGYSFSYGEDPQQVDYGQLRRVQSSNGSFLGFNYDTFGHIVEAYTGDGRRLRYDYNSSGDLIRVIRPDASEVSYDYLFVQFSKKATNGTKVVTITNTESTHLLIQEKKPDGRVLVNQYDPYRRVTNQFATIGPDLRPVRMASFTYANNFLLASATNSLKGMTTVLDYTNRATIYRYTNSLIRRITDPLGQSIQQVWYTNTANGGYRNSLKLTVDKRGLTNFFYYDGRGNLTNRTISGNLTGGTASNETASSSLAYNENNLLTNSVDASGNTNAFYYTGHLLTGAVTRPLNGGPGDAVTNLFEYLTAVHPSAPALFSAGLRHRATRAANSPDAAVLEWTYDYRGFPLQEIRRTGTTDPDVARDFFYNNRGELVESTDAAGRRTRFDYDAMGRPKWTEVIDETGRQLSGAYSYYNGNGELVWSDGPRYDPEDYVWRDYDGAGRLTQEMRWRTHANYAGNGVELDVGDAAYPTTFNDYDPFGNLIKATDPRGHFAVMDYDGLGRLVRRRNYDGDTGAAVATNRFAYEPGDQVSASTNALGAVTRSYYTSTGLLKRRENPDGSTNFVRYYRDGREGTNFLSNGSWWETLFDDARRQVTRRFRNAGGTLLLSEVREYDRRGNLLQATDVEGRISTNAYDGLDRLRVTAGPPGQPGLSEQKITTSSYDAAGVTSQAVNALGEKVITTSDALGRTLSVEVRSAAGQLARKTTTAYAPNHHSSVTTEGVVNPITTEIYTDNAGRIVLTRRFPGAGQVELVRHEFDSAGNLVAKSTEDADYGYDFTSLTYDALNRLVTQIRNPESDATPPRPGEVIQFGYNAAGNLTNRAMPGGLRWSARYTNDGRLLHEELRGTNGPAERVSDYAYFTSGPNIGLLRQITDARGLLHTNAYDAWLRVTARNVVGPKPEQNVATSFAYDKLGRPISISQTTLGRPSTALARAYDGYGQVVDEQVSINGAVVSRFAQKWDAAGRRTRLQSGDLSQWRFDFAHRADGVLTSVASGGYGFNFAYGDHGLLDSRANPWRTTTVTQRDGLGRVRQTTTPLPGGALGEAFEWGSDGRLADYAAVRPGFTDARNFSYNYSDMNRLIVETLPSLNGAPTQLDYFFDSYDYDDGTVPPNLGVLSDIILHDGSLTNFIANWWSPAPAGINALGRVREEFSDVARRLSGGYASGAARVQLTVSGREQKNVLYDPTSLNGYWRAGLELTTGPGSTTHSVSATAHHASGQGSQTAFSTYPVQVKDRQTNSYDPDGNLTLRTLRQQNNVLVRTQALVWDGLGRLVSVIDRDTGGDGLDWSAVYDPLGRRLRTTQNVVVNYAPLAGQTLTLDSLYDPQVEFLEIAVSVNGARTWKIYGPDLSGGYGGMQGVGGLEATIREWDGAATGIQNDHFGNSLATLSLNGPTWHNAKLGAYGPLSGFPVPLLSHTVSPAESLIWRGLRLDPTGFYWIGARYYDASSGRFLSADPLGHAASLSLYDFCGGDPINYFDPDGRGKNPAYSHPTTVGGGSEYGAAVMGLLYAESKLPRAEQAAIDEWRWAKWNAKLDRDKESYMQSAMQVADARETEAARRDAQGPGLTLIQKWEYDPTTTFENTLKGTAEWTVTALTLGEGMAARVVARAALTDAAGTFAVRSAQADAWMASGAAESGAFRAINPAYAESTAQSGFFRSGAAGRLGNDGIYANSTVEGAIAEFQYHNPGVNPAVFRVQYPASPTLNISPPSGYFNQPLPFTQGANVLTAPSLRAPGTVNLLIREGAVPAGRIQ